LWVGGWVFNRDKKVVRVSLCVFVRHFTQPEELL
jgi:hypothetical protein